MYYHIKFTSNHVYIQTVIKFVLNTTGAILVASPIVPTVLSLIIPLIVISSTSLTMHVGRRFVLAFREH